MYYTCHYFCGSLIKVTCSQEPTSGLSETDKNLDLVNQLNTYYIDTLPNL